MFFGISLLTDDLLAACQGRGGEADDPRRMESQASQEGAAIVLL